MSLNPTTSPKVFHGFWRSYGGALPKGPVLTLSTDTSKLFISFIALLVPWAFSRLYRILTAIIFLHIFKPHDSRFENSIAATMVVNIQSPLEGITATFRHCSWRRKAFIFIFAASLFSFVLGPGVVAGLSYYLPSYRAGLLLPNHCGLAPIATDKLLFTAYNARRTQWADAALRDVDRNETDTSTNTKATPPTALPTPSQSYVLECPPGAPACTISFPFTFRSNYTLHSKHFGLDTNMPFSLHVSDTCYRPRAAVARLPIDVPGNPKLYGLFYGPLNFSSLTANGQSNFISTPYTESLYAGGEFFPGYRLSQYAARVDDLFDSDWSPNSTLLLGGDTTILFYYIGGVAMVQPSSDPLFATDDTLTIVLPTREVLYRSSIVATIVCDTKYQVCMESGHNCSPIGGVSDLIKWFGANEQPDLSSLFAASLFRPPIYQASLGSGAVAASQTAPGGVIQLAPDAATAQRELSRLSQAGMMMLASFVRMSASGYWNVGLGSQSLTPTTSSLLCDRVIIETKDSISIPFTPYIVLLAVIFIVVAVSYADLCLKLDGLKLNRWRKLSDSWAVHKPGPMLRRLTEVLRKEVIDVKPSDKWGLAKSDTFGPDVVELHGAKRFDLALTTLPKSVEGNLANNGAPPKLGTSTVNLDTAELMQPPHTLEYSLLKPPSSSSAHRGDS